MSGYVSADTGAPDARYHAYAPRHRHGCRGLKGGTVWRSASSSTTTATNELQNWLSGGNMVFNGSVTGDAAADMLLGKFYSYRQVTGLTSRLRQNLPSFFAQDDLKLSRRLTVNLGLRWEPYFGYVSENSQLMAFSPGKQSTVFPKAPAGLLFPGDRGLPPSIIGSRMNNFGPRAGLAWDVRGDGKTSVRAGFGVFWVPMTTGINLNRFTLIQPFTTDLTVFGADAYNIFGGAPFNGVSPFPRPNAADLNALKQADFVPTANENSFALPVQDARGLSVEPVDPAGRRQQRGARVELCRQFELAHVYDGGGQSRGLHSGTIDCREHAGAPARAADWLDQQYSEHSQRELQQRPGRVQQEIFEGTQRFWARTHFRKRLEWRVEALERAVTARATRATTVWTMER